MLDIVTMLFHILRAYLPSELKWSAISHYFDMFSWTACMSIAVYCVFWTLRRVLLYGGGGGAYRLGGGCSSTSVGARLRWEGYTTAHRTGTGRAYYSPDPALCAGGWPFLGPIA